MRGAISAWMSERRFKAKARRAKKYLSTALVVFHCQPEEVAALDVAIGPCIWRVGPRGGRLRPIAAPSSQLYSGTFSQLASLYTVLTGSSPESALEEERHARAGTLARLSEGFAQALANLDMDAAGTDAQVEAMSDVAGRWYAATSWPGGMQAGGVLARVLTLAHAANIGRAKGHLLYAWHGPAVRERVLVRGVGAESYAAYSSRGRS